jgi:hypothetical protein
MRLDISKRLVDVCPEQAFYENFIIETKDDSWGRKIGGITTKERNHGFLDPKYAKESSTWKSKGGQIGTTNWHVKMKKEQPYEYGKIQYQRIKQSLKYKYEFNGQKYRNRLELEIAEILTKNNFLFKYERPLNCGSTCYFPDFTLGDIVIECTFWDDAVQKAMELTEKAESYRKLKMEIIVITTDRYFKNYLELLADLNVTVITSNKLTEVLDGKFGRVKRA